MQERLKEKVFTTYIKGMYCIQCPEIIISALLQKRGIIDADVAYFKSELTVKYDPEILTQDEIKNYLAEIGYPAVYKKPLLSEKLLDKIAHAFEK